MNTIAAAALRTWAVPTLMMAVGYYVAGRLALLLAIPPGYSTAFWPPAGIALAGLLLAGWRALPGIWLGSLLVNLGTSFDGTSASALLRSVALPAGIGLGAVLQAVVGAWLVRRFVGFPDPLNQERLIVRLLLLAGPVSCLVGAAVGVTMLRCAGRIQPAEIPFNGWTWWVGDVIGVLLVLPLVLLWIDRGHADWPRRPVTVTIPLAVMAAVVVALFVYTSRQEQERIRLAFEFRTDTLTLSIQHRMEKNNEALYGFRSYQGIDGDRDGSRFRQLARGILERRPSLLALSWSPRVKDAERTTFEEAARRHLAGFSTIMQQGAGASLEAAARRDEYFPIFFFESLSSNSRAFGFDVGSEANRRQALEQARDSGNLVATAPVILVEQHAADKSAALFLAIYRDGVTPPSVAERRQALAGFMVAIVPLGHLAELSWEGLDHAGIAIQFADRTDELRLTALERAPPPLEFSEGTRTRDAAPPPSELERTTVIPVAGRRWALHFALTPDFLAAHRSLQSWSVLAAGLLFTGLLGAMLLVVTGRSALIEDLVRERTAQLARANTDLKKEIDDRHRAEEQARESHEQSRLIIDTAADAFIAMDAQGIITDWNRQAETMFGWTRHEAVGRMLAECVIPQRFREAHQRGLKEFLATGKGPILFQRLELEALFRDGREFPVELTVWPLQAGGSVVFNAFIRDISERREAEGKIRLESAPDGMVIVNELGLIEQINSQAEKMFGYPRAELLQQRIEILMPERYRDNHVRFREAFFGDPQARPMGWGLELYGRRKDGSEFFVEISLSPLETRQGTLVTAAIRDITERKRVEQQLKQFNEILAQRVSERTAVLEQQSADLRAQSDALLRSNQELDEFAHIVSHDLKEPIRGIGGYASLLIEEYHGKLDDEGRAKLDTLGRLCGRMTALLDSLLNFSRLGRVELAWGDADLNQIVADVLDSLRVMLQQRRVTVRFEAPLPVVQCDRIRVGQVFRNLITNAIKYNDKLEKWVEIGFRLPEAPPHPVVFHVRDNGIGIPVKHREVIFRLFKRLHTRDKFGGGTGAGLTIAKRIVERHGGRIWLESTVGVGTCFYFTLHG